MSIAGSKFRSRFKAVRHEWHAWRYASGVIWVLRGYDEADFPKGLIEMSEDGEGVWWWGEVTSDADPMNRLSADLEESKKAVEVIARIKGIL